jgi:hypothetical protein
MQWSSLIGAIVGADSIPVGERAERAAESFKIGGSILIAVPGFLDSFKRGHCRID